MATSLFQGCTAQESADDIVILNDDDYSAELAEQDIENGTLKILTYGEPMPVEWFTCFDEAGAEIGLTLESVAGCVVTDELVDGVAAYNATVKAHIAEQYGEDWYTDFIERKQDCYDDI